MGHYKAAAILFFASAILVNSLPTSDEKSNYLLPKDLLKVISYDISLELKDDFYKTKAFVGEVAIKFQALKDATSIKIHYVNDLKPENVVFKQGYDNITVTINKLAKYDMYEIKFKEKLTVNKEYDLLIHYDGTLRVKDMYGFYLSSYKNKDKDEYLATTQFEPTHARKAFPCFDEPSYKATFALTIKHPSDYHSLSNTKVESVTKENDLIVTKFTKTNVMSTYLLAFVVSKFTDKSTKYPESSVWSRFEDKEDSEYAFSVAPKIIEELDKFTGIPYYKNMEKLDQIAIPDFAAGAMENWGLVTYREAGLLWNEKDSSDRNKQRVGTVIAHELTHQWFGNLVTLDWWADTWLNEGFATYFEYHIAAEVEKDWQLQHQFVVEKQQSVFLSDALQKAWALHHQVYEPKEISAMFSDISYDKGASVIRMMRHFLGQESFQKGLQKYLTDNSFKNAKYDDLLAALQPSDDKMNLKEIMKNWITEPGYPVVHVDTKDKKLVLKQKKFRATDVNENPSDVFWHVPVSLTNSKDKKFDDTKPKYWLEPKGDAVTTDIAHDDDKDGWVILNIQESAYYRVNYSEHLWRQIMEGLQKKDFDKIHVINRAQIVDDVLNLARAKEIRYELALDIVSYLTEETEYYPWCSAFKAFNYLRRRIGRNELGDAFDEFLVHLMQNLFKSVSFDVTPSSQVDIHKQTLALEWACELGVKECTDKAKKLFDNYINHGEKINPNVRSIVYCYAIQQDKTDVSFTKLLKKLEKTQVATEVLTIIKGLGCTKNKDLLAKYLKMSIDDKSPIRSQDANYVYNSVLTGTPEGIEVAFKFIEDNYDKISEKYGGLNALENVINSLGDRLTTKEQVDKFKNMLKDKNIEGSEAAIENAVANIKWAEYFKKDFVNYFIKPSTSKPSSTTKNGADSLSQHFLVLCPIMFLLRKLY